MQQKIQVVKHSSPQPFKPGANPGNMLIGAFGWLALIAAVGALAIVFNGGQARMARIRENVLDAQKQNQAQLEVRQAGIVQARERLTTDSNAEVDLQTKSLRSIQALSSEIARLKPGRDENQARLAKLKTSVAALGEDLSLINEGVGELKTKSAQLQQQKQELLGVYRERYAAMTALYEEKLARPEPEMLRQFYGTHQNTPFGPAALFFAAEKLYEGKKSGDAARLYETLVRKYPDSGYVAYSQQRLQTIKDRIPFEKMAGVGLLPYKALPAAL